MTEWERTFEVLVPVEALERAADRWAEGRALLLNANKPGYSERFTIDSGQYELLVDAILRSSETLANDRGEVRLKDIVATVQLELQDHPKFPGGRLTNYVRYVKVDLEARGYLRRVDGSGPQRLRRRP